MRGDTLVWSRVYNFHFLEIILNDSDSGNPRTTLKETCELGGKEHSCLCMLLMYQSLSYVFLHFDVRNIVRFYFQVLHESVIPKF